MDDIILLKRTNKQNNKPTPTQLQHGEIAINYKKDNENIFIKNDNDEIIGFSYKNELQEKVDKIEGKGLSTNDFTNELKNKLENIDGDEFTQNIYNNILNKLAEQYPDLATKETIYEYKGAPVGAANVLANFDASVTIDKNFSDYDYIDVFCKTDDGWNMSQRLINPNGQVLTFCASNVTGSGYLAMKAKAYEFLNNVVKSVATTWGNKVTLSGVWLSQYKSDTGKNELATNSDAYIGLSKIIGYKQQSNTGDPTPIEYNLVGKFTGSTSSRWNWSPNGVYMSLVDYTNPETKEFSLKYDVPLTSCYRCFYSNSYLERIDKFPDTSNVTNMNWMFRDCTSLKSLDLSNFDTSNVTNMSQMFEECSGLTSLDLSNFDTSNVTTMYNMFYNCKSLTHIKCKQAFKDLCIKNQSSISLPAAMRNGGSGTWEIVD